MAGVDPSDGKVLWNQKITAFRGMNILTPTVIGNSIFTSSYGGRSLLLTANKDQSDWSISEKWSNKSQGYMSSPIVIAGHIYLHLRNQRFTCIDIASGETKWTTTPFGQYWSMITDGDKIIVLDEKGDLLLIKANQRNLISSIAVLSQTTVGRTLPSVDKMSSSERWTM
jgi:outer membrane protein assembly factor BamB